MCVYIYSRFSKVVLGFMLLERFYHLDFDLVNFLAFLKFFVVETVELDFFIYDQCFSEL